MQREGYAVRDTKEAKTIVYWNLDDYRREERTTYFDSKIKKDIVIPPLEVTFILNDRPYQELVRIIDQQIREGELTNIEHYAKTFHEYYWALHFPHWYDQVARHGKYDLRMYVESKDKLNHHSIVEDGAITLGKALNLALGDKRGIKRFGHGYGAQEGVKADITVDISGRPRASLKTRTIDPYLDGMVQHFAYSFTDNAKLTLVGLVSVLDKVIQNEHHKIEALFKGLALALSEATSFDEKTPEYLPSTKEKLD